ncbi:MAG: helix-turn-helix transcriptional regulator [Bacteroidetes bacterium]|nr:helix-turn-helix transcriptional regulator [Bacteroidota bacterium]
MPIPQRSPVVFEANGFKQPRPIAKPSVRYGNRAERRIDPFAVESSLHDLKKPSPKGNGHTKVLGKQISSVVPRCRLLRRTGSVRPRILLKKSHARSKLTPNLKNEIVLTEKERDVLRNIYMEYTAAEIAEKMGISPRTVEAIKDRLMDRFSTKNTAGLVFFAVKNDLID